ncbi:MAG: ATP-binding protein [Acidobacteriota bacterium]
MPTDRGDGVPEHLLTRIFDSFYRVDESRDEATGGIGLGLAIASRAIQVHHGSITAENADPGLRVTLAVPSSAA